MNKKNDYKKTLVRNTEVKRPSQVTLKKCTKQSTEKPSTSGPLKEKSNTPKLLDSATKFETPELNTALKLARKIETIENIKPRKTKSVSSISDAKKLAAEEQVTRVINFPYEKQIFKDLVPLTVPKEPLTVISSIRAPLPNKDIEPVLSDFAYFRKMPEYSYQPKFKQHEKDDSWSLKKNDNLKLYKVLQISKETN